MKKNKKSIIKKILSDKEQLTCLFIVLLMQLLIKASPGFLNIGLIIIILTYIYSLTIAIYREQEDTYYDRIVKFTIFVLVNSPLIIYTIVLFFKTFPNTLIKIGDASTWIGFAGSIIGGSMTMFAIIFTIQYQNKIEASKSIPFISVDQIGINDDDDEGIVMVSIDEENDDIVIGPMIASFKIRNHSNFIAKNVNFAKIVTYNFPSYSKQDKPKVEYSQDYNPNYDLNLEFFYAESDYDFTFFLDHRNPYPSFSFILEFQIEFFDILDENKYLTTSKFLYTRTNNQRILGKDYSRENMMKEIREGILSEYEFKFTRISNILSRIE